MTTMLERVARAVVNEIVRQADDPSGDEPWCSALANNNHLETGMLTIDGRVDIAAIVRAAIEEMRVMNDVMYFAACDEMDEWTDPADGECIKAVFTTAIDAALLEQQP